MKTRVQFSRSWVQSKTLHSVSLLQGLTSVESPKVSRGNVALLPTVPSGDGGSNKEGKKTRTVTSSRRVETTDIIMFTLDFLAVSIVAPFPVCNDHQLHQSSATWCDGADPFQQWLCSHQV